MATHDRLIARAPTKRRDAEEPDRFQRGIAGSRPSGPLGEFQPLGFRRLKGCLTLS